MAKLQLWYPTDRFYIAQGFGVENTNPSVLPVYAKFGMKGHNGLDIIANIGDPVRASHEGVVTFTGVDGGAGNIVVLRTSQPYDYLNGEAYYKTVSGHLSEFKCKVGDKVSIGQIIGFAGNTGISTGPHVHYGLKPQASDEDDAVWYNLEPNNGYNGAIDPLPFFNHYYAKDIDYVYQHLTWKVQLLTLQVKLLQLLKGR